MQKTLSLKFCFGSAYFIDTGKLFAESTINKGKN